MQAEIIENHSKILNRENHKSKKKRVSFSIFNANTFEEMEDLRKQREKDFLNMINMKSVVNENVIKIKNDFSKTFDVHNNFKIPEEKFITSIQNNITDNNYLLSDMEKSTLNNNYNFFNHKLSKSNPNEIVKVENIFLNNPNYSNNVSNIISNNLDNNFTNFKPNLNNVNTDQTSNYINVIQNEEINTITNSLSIRSPKENLLFSRSYDNNNDPIIEEINQEDLVTNLNENYLINSIEKNSTKKIDINDNHNKIENVKSFIIEDITNIFTIYNFSNSLFDVLNSNLENKIKPFFNNFIENLKINQNLKKKQIYLDLLIKNFILKKIYNNFNIEVKNKIKNKKYSLYNNNHAEKFVILKKFNLKSRIFVKIKVYTNRRKEWYNKINRDLKLNLIW